MEVLRPGGSGSQRLTNGALGPESLATTCDEHTGELDRWHRLAWIVVGYIRHRRPPEEVDRLPSAATTAIEDASRGREVETIARTSAEELIEKGKEIGREEGRIAATRETLLRQMRQKFGVLSPSLEARVTAMNDASHLDDLLVRILTAISPQEMGL